MKKVILIASLILIPLLGDAGIALSADENIRFSSLAEVEVIETNAQGVKVTVRQPAVMVPPGGLVVYTNAFTNIGKEPAEDLVINNPVPENTEYLGGSATETGASVIFSADGGQTYASTEKLFIADGKGGKKLAEPKDYTHIRWNIQESLAPGDTGMVEFRVRVK